MATVSERCFPHAYVGVFDGHGGSDASEYCADYLHDNIFGSGYMPQDVLAAMQDGFLRTDADLLRRASSRRKATDVGTAAVTMLVTADALALAHAGDCRALLVKRSGSPVPFVELTIDHSAENHPLASGACSGQPCRPDEVLRVQRVGGHMDPGGYVCVSDHSLPMTRALGDLPLKVAAGRDWRTAAAREQVVTALPEVKAYPRSDDDLCVVLASDGLFGNVMTSCEVADFARAQLEGECMHAPDGEKQTARRLCDRAITQHQGCDNVTVAVVSLAPPAPSASADASALVVDAFHAAPTFDSQALLHGSNERRRPELEWVGPDLTDDVTSDGSRFMSASAVNPGGGHGAAAASSSAAFDPSLVALRDLHQDGAAVRPPTMLTSQLSQDSVVTADPCSPWRGALREKLKLPFLEAYPSDQPGKENVEGEAFALHVRR